MKRPLATGDPAQDAERLVGRELEVNEALRAGGEQAAERRGGGRMRAAENRADRERRLHRADRGADCDRLGAVDGRVDHSDAGGREAV